MLSKLQATGRGNGPSQFNVGMEDSFRPPVWTSVPKATITGNYICAGKISISGLGVTRAYL